MQRFKQLSLLCTIFISGCSFNPFSTDNHLTGSPTGTAVGAVAAGSTAAFIAPGKPLPIGLATAAGAAVGYYVTSLDFASGGIERAHGKVLAQGDCATVILPNYSVFEDNSAEIRPEAAAALRSTVSVLNYFPDNDIFISGNSAGFGTEKYDTKMSLKRAKNMAGYLWANGISGARQNDADHRNLVLAGFGPNFPIANHITAQGIQDNNRIQISTCPSPKDYRSTTKNAETANVGEYDKIQPPSPTEVLTENPFKTDELPSSPDRPTEKFRPVIYDHAPATGIKNYKGDKPTTRSYKGENTAKSF